MPEANHNQRPHTTKATKMQFLGGGAKNSLLLMLEPAVVNVNPEHHAHRVACLDLVQTTQEPACFRLPGIVYRSLPCLVVLQHEAIARWQWMKDTKMAHKISPWASLYSNCYK